MQRPKRSKAFFPLALPMNQRRLFLQEGDASTELPPLQSNQGASIATYLGSSYTAEFSMKAPLTCESLSSSYCQTAYSPPRPNPETFQSPPGPKQRARPRQWRQRTTEAPPSSFPGSRDRETPLPMAVGAVEAKQEAGSAAAGS